jgi:hypothetical protein
MDEIKDTHVTGGLIFSDAISGTSKTPAFLYIEVLWSNANLTHTEFSLGKWRSEHPLCSEQKRFKI